MDEEITAEEFTNDFTDDIEQKKLLERCRQLFIWETLCRQSDAEHPLEKQKLVARLAEKGFSVNEHTLKNDIRALQKMPGHGVIEHKTKKKEMTYYAENPQFTPLEMRVIYEALQANGSLSPVDLKNLRSKLFSMCGRLREDKLVEDLEETGIRSGATCSAMDRIKILDEACRLEKRVTFRYFYLDENRQQVVQRNGEDYTVEPIALLYRNNHYYLFGYDCQARQEAYFRVDRMQSVPELDRHNRKKISYTKKQLRDNIGQTLNMYHGEKAYIDLQLHDIRAIGILIDRFGPDVKIKPDVSNEWSANLMVQQSPELWGWLCAMSDIMTLTGPEGVRKKYTDWLQNALDMTKKN